MTTGRNKKKLVRDIQRRSGWSYTSCLRFIDALGYEHVSGQIDKALGECEEAFELTGINTRPNYEAIGNRLNEEMKKKAKIEAARKDPVEFAKIVWEDRAVGVTHMKGPAPEVLVKRRKA